jgi:hypothetical protein
MICPSNLFSRTPTGRVAFLSQRVDHGRTHDSEGAQWDRVIGKKPKSRETILLGSTDSTFDVCKRGHASGSCHLEQARRSVSD